MPKGIAGNLATELAITLATQPIILIEVEWRFSAPGLYATKDFAQYQGKILEFSGLDTVVKLESGGQSTEMTLKLSDVDDSIKDQMSISDIHKTPVKVFQNDGSLVVGDKVLIFDGEINSPITWSEHDRTVEFNILSRIESEEIGFSPEAGDLPFIAESAIGVPWPLCFGSPIRVPAIQVTEAVRGTSLTRYGQITITDLDNLCTTAETAAIAQDAKDGIFGADTQPGFSDDNYADVISTLTSATTDINNLIDELAAKSPTQRNNLISFVENCQFTKRAQIDLQLNAALFIQATAAKEAAQTALDTLQVELLAAQTEIPIDPIKIIGIQDQIAAAQIAFNTADAAETQAFAQIQVQNSNVATGEATKALLQKVLLAFVLTEIVVEGGERFPQATPVVIIINGMKFSGSFVGQIFTIDQPNLPFEVNIPRNGVRLNQNTNEIFISDSSLELKGKFLFMPEGLTYVEAQEGTRLFINPILYEQTGELPAVPNVLINGQPVIREVFEQIVFSGGSIQESRVFVPQEWIEQLDAGTTFANGRDHIRDQGYAIDIGDDVFLDGDFQDKYVANLIPSISIAEVIGRRDGELAVIPSRYYTINLNELLAGQNATTLSFRRPLTQYVDEEWDGDVFVSLTSSKGPNTADVIEYLLNTYTSVTPDAATFASVVTSLADYPSHFALLERSDALKTIENIAWQARCAIYLRNSIGFLIYLAAETVELFTFTPTNIKDLVITTRTTEDLVTKLVALWRSDYTLEKPKEVVLRNNIPKYGEQKTEFDFFIYNIESLVVKSATFWIIRLSNTWKIARFTAFLDALDLDVFDIVKMDISFIALVPGTLGVIREANYDPESNTIVFEVENEVLFGDDEPHPFYWPATADPGLSYPSAKDPFAGTP